ncbi:MAG: DUF72 domain-containing protein, partial [bacterium]
MEPFLPFESAADTEKGSIRVGVAGWSHEDWKGIVYPSKRKRNFDPLGYLSQLFDTIEIDSTYYRPATAKNFENWAERVQGNPRFRFSVKCWKRLTQEPRPISMDDIKQVMPGLEVLRVSGNIGCLLLQFPRTFTNTKENRVYLREVKECFESIPLVLEVPHVSWDQDAVYAFLEDMQIGFSNLDQPLFRTSLMPTERVTAPVAYVRLLGGHEQDVYRKEAGRDERLNYLYSKAELEALLHETLHASDWSKSEEIVSRIAKEQARLLWRLGYR